MNSLSLHEIKKSLLFVRFLVYQIMRATMSIMRATAWKATFSKRMFPTTVLVVRLTSTAEVCWSIMMRAKTKAISLCCMDTFI